MWRTFAVVAALLYGTATTANACITDAGYSGITFDQIPDNASANALILDVVFDDITDDTPIYGEVIKARVRNVVRGEYRGDYVRVGIPNSSCSRPFLFGTEGLIVGELRNGPTPFKITIAHERWSTIVDHYGHNGTWFSPQTESLQSRHLRGASVPFVPVDRVLSVDRSSGMPLVQDEPMLTWFDPTTRALRHGVMGDYDGDGRADRPGFIEDAAGNLVITVDRAAARGRLLTIWSGDVSSRPYFTVTTTGPGTYRTMCHLYDGCGEAVPAEVVLTHDALIVHALEGPAEFLYYWDGVAFQNIIISE